MLSLSFGKFAVNLKTKSAYNRSYTHQKRVAPTVAKQNLLPYQSTQKKSIHIFIEKIKMACLFNTV